MTQVVAGAGVIVSLPNRLWECRVTALSVVSDGDNAVAVCRREFSAPSGQSKMRTPVKVLLHAIYVICVSLMLCFTESRFAWMAAVDPSISAGSIADDSGNREVFLTILLLIVAVATQVVVAVKASGAAERYLPAAFGIAAVAIFML